MSPVPADPADIIAWSRNFLADLLDRPLADIDAEAGFAALGLDSAKSVQFVLGLEERFGVELDPEIVEHHPGIAALARHLAGLPGPR